MNSRKISNQIVDLYTAKRVKLDEIEAKQKKAEEEIKRLKKDYNELNWATTITNELMACILAELPAACVLSCERVCTRWSEYVRYLNIKKLVFAGVEERKPRKWRHSNEVCDLRSIIVRDDFRLSFESENSLLSNLRCLKIDNKYDDYRNDRILNRPFLTNFDLINKLTRLEVLEISKIDFESDKETTITLPNLTYLAIDQVHSKLKLTTPMLSSFRTGALKNVTFVFPEKITHLYLSYEFDIETFKFPNLEYLCLKVPFIEGSLQPAEWDQLLGYHLKLKILSIRPSLKRLNKSAYDSVKNFALHILERKKSDNRSFRIVFFGIYLEDESQLKKYRYKKNLVKLQLQNFSKLCSGEMQWFKQLNYVSLLNHFGDEIKQIPVAFFETFKFVNEIYVRNLCQKRDEAGKDTQEERLIEFLTKFKGLQSLKVSSSELSEGFFGQLSKLHPDIWRLEIKEDDYDYCLGKSIFEFKNLYQLRTSLSQDEDGVEKVFSVFDNCFCFTFEYNGGLATVERKNDKSSYLLYYEKILYKEHKDLGEVLTYLYEHFGD